jgi:hypothetical protein
MLAGVLNAAPAEQPEIEAVVQQIVNVTDD